jgi:hypothetical protein
LDYCLAWLRLVCGVAGIFDGTRTGLRLPALLYHFSWRQLPLSDDELDLTNRSSQPLAVVKFTFGFYETVLDVCPARYRQRWLSSVSFDDINTTHA